MIYHFGSCTVDTGAYELLRDGERVPVEPQVFDLLILLLDNRDRIVTRDEIVEGVWRGRIVSEAAISSRIKSARRAIGDDGKSQGMIRTIHRRGLRFVGDVAVDEAPPRSKQATEDVAVIGTEMSSMLKLGTRAPAGADIIAHAGDPSTGIDLSLPKRPSLVVLPFHLLSSEAEHRVIADGLSLDIMTGLARTRWLFVIARGTAFTFRSASHDPRQVSARLGVRYVLQGTIQLRDRRVRISAGLTDAVGGREVWADQFERAVDELFSIQDEISSIIIGAVEAEIEQSERQRALLAQPSNLDAWSAYHRATWHMFQFTPQGYEEAERLFERAARLDPGSARVFAGLSFVHWQRAFLEIGKDRQGEIDRAAELARHALMLDPRDPQGHWALGRALQLRQEFDLAIDELEQAVSLNPNFALGHYSLAFARGLATQNAESEVSARLARRLSPYDLMSFAMLATQAINAVFMGQKDAAADLADRAAGQPNAHYHILAIAAFCNAEAGRDAAASRHLHRLSRAHPGYRIADYLRAFPYRDPAARERVRMTLSTLGLQD